MATGRLPLEEFARLPSFYVPEVDHQGERVAYYADPTGRLELYLMDVATGEARQVSDGELPRSLHEGFVWSRDGAGIVFAKDRDGDEQHDLWWFDLTSRQARQLTATPRAQESPGEFAPDGRRLAMISNRAGQRNVWLLDPAGGEPELLTAFANPCSAGRWSPDGAWLVLHANTTTDLRNLDAYLIRPDGSELRRVFRTEVGVIDGLDDWHPDGGRVSVVSETGGVLRVGLMTLADGSVRWLGDGRDEERGGRFSRDGQWVAVARNRDASVQPLLYHVETGEERALKLPPGIGQVVDFVLDDRAVLLAYTSSTRRRELWRYDLSTDSVEVLLPAEYGSIDPGIFVQPEYRHYHSADGTEIPAILYVPRDLAPGERRPAIVSVHGGPAGQWTMGFDPFAQFLTDRGFVVLEPNIRGSAGYGKAFREANLMDWGGADLEDVAAGAGLLKSLEFVDGDRLGVFGGSYGGYMTYLQVVKKPELWKAAVAWVGITDLLLMYGESMEHYKYFLRLYLGDPADHADLWRERSALHFADRLRARLLMVHGVNDPRCPITQARVFRDKLLELGKVEGDDFEYVELGDEGHGSTDPDHRTRTYALLADFMERRL